MHPVLREMSINLKFLSGLPFLKRDLGSAPCLYHHYSVIIFSSLFSGNSENVYDITIHHLQERIGNGQQDLLVRKATQACELIAQAKQM